MNDLIALRRQTDTLLREYQFSSRKVKDEKANLKETKKRLEDTVKAQEIVQLVAQTIQQEAHEHITKIVSRCLKTIFDDPYEFKIDFVRTRGKTEARLKFFRNGYEYSPRGGTGGGVRDVAAWALRLACIILQKPKRRKLMVCDEPFKFLHTKKLKIAQRKMKKRLKLLIETLAEELGFQFIFISGNHQLEVGTVVQL